MADNGLLSTASLMRPDSIAMTSWFYPGHINNHLLQKGDGALQQMLLFHRLLHIVGMRDTFFQLFKRNGGIAPALGGGLVLQLFQCPKPCKFRYICRQGKGLAGQTSAQLSVFFVCLVNGRLRALKLQVDNLHIVQRNSHPFLYPVRFFAVGYNFYENIMEKIYGYVNIRFFLWKILKISCTRRVNLL